MVTDPGDDNRNLQIPPSTAHTCYDIEQGDGHGIWSEKNTNMVSFLDKSLFADYSSRLGTDVPPEVALAQIKTRIWLVNDKIAFAMAAMTPGHQINLYHLAT